MSNKVLFLDIDGVLNYENYYTLGRRGACYPISELCPLAIEQLNRIIATTGCSIVISSTWRHSGIEYCRNALYEAGLVQGSIIDITPSLDRLGAWVERGNEILKWRMDNKHYSYDEYRIVNHNYVIVDDDSDMLYQQRDNFFQVHPKYGLTAEIADKVIQFLNIEKSIINS